jgi:transcription termination factor Rho
MKNTLQRNLKLVGIALAVVFGIGTLTSVQAQQNQNNRKDDRRNDNQIRRGNDDRYENDRDDNNRNRGNRDDDDRYNDNRNNGNYGNNNGYYGSQNKNAFRQAYAEGLRRGADDARDGRRFNANRAAGKAMERMNNGRYNNYGISRQEFRDAFIRGYEKAFRQYEDQYDDRNGYGNGRGNNGRGH